jgi:hypothetical protein
MTSYGYTPKTQTLELTLKSSSDFEFSKYLKLSIWLKI